MELSFDHITASCHLYIKETLTGCRIMECTYTYDSTEEFIHLVTLDVKIQPWARLLDMFYMAQKSFVMMTSWNGVTVIIYTAFGLRYNKHSGIYRREHYHKLSLLLKS